MSSPLDFTYNNNPTAGFIAQEIGSLFPEIKISEQPSPKIAMSISAPPESNISMYGGKNEILKITEDGFYVRGKKVEADEEEAAAVYRAFKEFLVYHALTRN
jgi:hypothetical protein